MPLLVADDLEDQGNFSISMDGVLTFKSPPDFETMMGGTDNDSNTYKLVVVSSDDAPGAETVDTPIRVAYHKVTVTVTDVDEDGTVSLSGLQPQVDVPLNNNGTPADTADDAIATLKDQDASTTQINAAKWKWEQSSAINGPWTLISGETSPSYTPTADVAGMYVRLTATYNDKHGDDKTAMATSVHAVRAVPSGTNSAPTFNNVGREVDENSPPGTNVGKPVKADDAPDDVLTYTLTGSDDDEWYDIDPATGQIMVAARTVLNRESDATGLPGGATDTVTVTATDPSGEATAPAATVTITVKDVNEAPVVNGGPTTIETPENEAIDVDSTPDEVTSPTYLVTDPETTTPTNFEWSVTGPDAGDFNIGNQTGGTPGQLTFKENPDFENSADADRDNVYEVTVKVTDNGTPKMSATRDVMITVTNANDPGMIKLSSVQPKVGIPFIATLTDEDGVVMESVKWQWYDDDPDSITPGTLDSDADTHVIANAKSATYTPKAADAADDVILHVWATYTDSSGSTSATNMADNTVVVNLDNQAPQFRAGGESTGKVITSDTRTIAEDIAAVSTDDDASDVATDNIGAAVTAVDPNPADIAATLTYTLGGTDASNFRVRQTVR